MQNDLWPIFDDEEITVLFKKIYFEKPRLVEQLQEVQAQIDKLQTVVLLSSEFDYTQLLAKYNLAEIDKSVIKYYQAVQQWTDELLDRLGDFEQQKEEVINDFNLISLKLSKKYEQNDNLTDKENILLQKRQQFFKSRSYFMAFTLLLSNGYNKKGTAELFRPGLRTFRPQISPSPLHPFHRSRTFHS